ncbi:transcriptional regulator [Pseudalkalibacillus salsuginis]|uniref:transcriptional regulator n=1 Tax=Pseudalkalibacillus salsuginis TaxID=2910972 RepID=UPI001F20ADC7|nr:transcriptional regulator [Pseudalkalibacillus salsuginis]MCF6411790.1 tetratricopeptide repeat protein [Pseudalkalibacillus salsuginis]
MIGQRIRYYRKTKGLTQEELARGICSISYLSKIENGDAKSSEDVIELLCEKLGISAAEEQLDVNILGLLNEWNYLMTSRKWKESSETQKKIETYIPFIEDPVIQLKYKVFLVKSLVSNKKFDKADKLIKEIKNHHDNKFESDLEFHYNHIIGIYFYNKKEFQSSLSYFENAEKFIQQIPLNPVERGVFFYNLALAHSHFFHNTSVINYCYKALEIFDKEYNFNRSADCHILLGISNRRINNYSQARFHFNKALKFAETFNELQTIAIIYHNLGYVHSSMGETKKAIELYHKSINLKSKLPTQDSFITYYLIAREYFRIKDKKSSLEWLNKVKEKLDENYNYEYYLHYSILYKRVINELDESYENLLRKEAIPYFNKKNLWEYLSDASELLAEYYFKKSQYKKSSEYYKLANDSRKNFF